MFPPEQCKDGMRAQIYFPHCWLVITDGDTCGCTADECHRDGVNAWLEGSKHVSYGEGRFDGGGQCPPTHPKRIMGRECGSTDVDEDGADP